MCALSRPYCLLLLVLFLVSRPVTAQERPRGGDPPPETGEFVLDLPGQPEQSATAVVEATSLTITDADGNRFLYVRRPDLDSPDEMYLGFFSRRAGQTLRWPAEGAGPVYVRDASTGEWGRSPMEVRPTERRVRVRRLPAPVPPPPDPLPLTAPAHVAVLPHEGRFIVAYIDGTGRLHFYEGRRDRWQYREAPLTESLAQGAPLVLSRDRGRLPTVHTVSAAGDLVEIVNGRDVRPILEDAEFVSGTSLAVLDDPRTPRLAAIDDRGRIVEADLRTGRTYLVESRPRRYLAGGAIDAATERPDELFLVDRSGTLVRYRLRYGEWQGPEIITTGFPAGAAVTAELLAGGTDRPVIHLAAVDSAGRLRIFREVGGGWVVVPVGDIRLTPGVPVALADMPEGLSFSAVDIAGVWYQWVPATEGGWVRREITRGFLVGTPVVVHPRDQSAFAVDATGRLIAGNFIDGTWVCVTCLHEADYQPRLVRREIVPDRPLRPVEVFFDNSSPEEMLVEVYDQFTAAPALRHRIRPGGTASQRLNRESGAILEEVYLVPGPRGRWIEQESRQEIPPQPRYLVTVSAYRPTYRYVDRLTALRPPAVADFEIERPVTIGSFSLPPGNRLQDRDRFDVYREALLRPAPRPRLADVPPLAVP